MGNMLAGKARFVTANRQIGVPSMASIVPTEVFLCRTTESELDLRRRTGIPWGGKV